MIALQAIRVLILSGLAFLMALALAPLLIKILKLPPFTSFMWQSTIFI